MKKRFSRFLLASATTAFLFGATHSLPIESQQINSNPANQASSLSLNIQPLSQSSLFAKANTDQYESADDESAGEAAAFAILVIVLICILIYFAPLAVALLRSSHLVGAVAIVNIFLGWTFIGWVIAFVMAVLPESKNGTVIVQQAVDAGQSVERDKNK